jgi:hypothetical protein
MLSREENGDTVVRAAEAGRISVSICNAPYIPVWPVLATTSQWGSPTIRTRITKMRVGLRVRKREQIREENFVDKTSTEIA